MTRSTDAFTELLVSGVSRMRRMGINWARTASRLDSNGAALTGPLREPAVENRCWQSRNPAVTWDQVALTSITPNGKEGWDAIADYVDGLVGDANDTQHGFSDALALTAVEWIIWAVFEKGDKDWVYLFDSTVANAWGYFNKATAAKGTMGTGVTASWCIDLGGGRVLCAIGVTGTAAAHTVGYYSANANNDNDFPGDAVTVNTWASDMQVEIGLFPSTFVESRVGTGQRGADSDLEFNLGAKLAGGKGTILFDFLCPTYSGNPGAAVDVLRLTDGGAVADAVLVQIDTARKLGCSSAKTAGNAGASTPNLVVTDNRIYRARICFKENSFQAWVKDLDTGTVTEGTKDTSCDIAAGMDTLEIAPSGCVVGWETFRIYPDVRKSWNLDD